MSAADECGCGGEHREGALYYVTCVDGGRVGYVAGPFADHPSALAMVEPARKMALKVNQWSHFYAFGTCALPPEHPRKVGALNAQLGITLPPVDATTDQPGPPTEEARVVRDIEFVRVAQLRFLEGYRARMAEPHPMRKNAKGKELSQRETRWSFADLAHGLESVQPWPAHERERWIAGFLHADSLAATEGTHAMDRADPGRPPPRKRRAKVAEQVEACPEAVFDRAQLNEWKARRDARTRRDAYAYEERRSEP
jgi:hypothetical protein